MAGMPGIVIRIGADTVDAIQGINKVNRALGDAAGPSEKFSRALGTVVAPAMLAAGAAAGVFAIQFGAASIQAASDLNEMQTKIDQVFGASGSATIKQWAEDSATAMGLSKTAALDAASQFGIFGQAAGLSGSETIAFSEKLTGLAGDLASFSNVPVADALQAIQAGLRGESEPLRKFGVLLDDATLKAAAMEMGIYSGTGVLTQQQKILAANKTIFEQTTKAQGDYARTADGLANTQRTLNAAFENAKATIGQGLLDAINQVTSAMGGGKGIAGTIDSLAQSFAGFAHDVGNLLTPLGYLAAKLDDVSGRSNTLLTILWPIVGVVGLASDAYDGMRVAVAAVTGNMDAQESALRSMRGLQELHNGTLRDSYAALAAYAPAIANAAAEERKAADASAYLTQKMKEQDAAISKITSRIDLADYYRTLKSTLDKSSDSLNINTEAGSKNARTLIDGYQLVMAKVKDWAASSGASAAQVAAKTDKEMRKLRANLIAQGLNRTDIDRFLNQLGWDGALANLAKSAATAGGKIGRGLGDGILQGMTSRERAVATEAARLTAMAEAAAKKQAEQHSPSKVWERIGKGLGDGLVKGIQKTEPQVAKAAKNVVDAATNATKAIGQALMDQVKADIEKHIEDLNTAVDAVHALKEEMVAYGQSLAQAITGSISLSEAWSTGAGNLEEMTRLQKALDDARAKGDEQAIKSAQDARDAFTGNTSWLDLFKKQISDSNTFATGLADLARGLGTGPGSRAFIDQIAALGPTAGNALLSEMSLQTAQDLAGQMGLALAKADAAGIGIAKPFYEQGINAATATVQGILDQITADETKLRELGQKFGIPIGEEIKTSIVNAYNAAMAEIGGKQTAAAAAGTSSTAVTGGAIDKGTTIINNISVPITADQTKLAKQLASIITTSARRVGTSR